MIQRSWSVSRNGSRLEEQANGSLTKFSKDKHKSCTVEGLTLWHSTGKQPGKSSGRGSELNLSQQSVIAAEVASSIRAVFGVTTACRGGDQRPVLSICQATSQPIL